MNRVGTRRPQGRLGRLAASGRRRPALRIASLALFALGIAAGALGVLAPQWSADTAPRRVGGTGLVTVLPQAGRFGGVVALYGRVSSERQPTRRIWGARCRRRSGTG